mgnify:CR=1
MDSNTSLSASFVKKVSTEIALQQATKSRQSSNANSDVAQVAAKKKTRQTSEIAPSAKGTGEVKDTSKAETPIAQIQKRVVNIIANNLDKDGDAKISEKEYFGFINSLNLDATEKTNAKRAYNILRQDDGTVDVGEAAKFFDSRGAIRSIFA